MAKAGRRTRITLFLVMAAVAVILDQIVKAWVRSALPKTGDTAPFIPGVLRLLHVENTGAAFSMGEGKGFFFVAIAVAIFILALLAVWKEELSVPFALACVSRRRRRQHDRPPVQGYVTDFFATHVHGLPGVQRRGHLRDAGRHLSRDLTASDAYARAPREARTGGPASAPQDIRRRPARGAGRRRRASRQLSGISGQYAVEERLRPLIEEGA
jgi:signal peptidase II